MIELIPFGNIFDKITDWFSSPIQKAKTVNEKESTRSLRDMAIVVSSVTTIDHIFRKIILDLKVFSIKSSEEKREAVAQKIQTSVSDESIITEIRRSMRSIKEQQPSKKFEFVKDRHLNFVGFTKQIKEVAGGIGERRFRRVTPFPLRENLTILVNAISPGKRATDANLISLSLNLIVSW